jgi:selenium donor protein
MRAAQCFFAPFGDPVPVSEAVSNFRIPMNAPDRAPLRLTEFSHGGGCGCKIAPAVLRQILGSAGSSLIPKELLVGVETSDDAAVFQLNERQAVVATTGFFMPIVDDPYDFGMIAATNAISDVYAMGGTPLFALALVGMPIDKLPVETIRRILDGGEAVCARAGIPIAGGHTIDSVEPIYGLVVIGLVAPQHLSATRARSRRCARARQALGIGVYSAALKRGRLLPQHTPRCSRAPRDSTRRASPLAVPVCAHRCPIQPHRPPPRDLSRVVGRGDDRVCARAVHPGPSTLPVRASSPARPRATGQAVRMRSP